MTTTRISLLFLSLFLCLGGLARADAPYNGGFEYLDRGLPIGWEPQGTWLSLNPGAYEGTKAIYLAGTVARAGDRLVSQGYRLASPSETLTLHVAYTAVQGGAVIGLLPCDALGQPLGDKAIIVSLPEAATWQIADRDLQLTGDLCPPGTAAVRVVLGVDCAAREVRYDAVSLTGPTSPPSAYCLLPTVDAYARPNLLRNPEFRRASDGSCAGWTALVAAAPAAGSTEAPPVAGSTEATSAVSTTEATPAVSTTEATPVVGATEATPAAGSTEAPPAAGLTLVAGDRQVAWISDRVPVDASLPYQCSLRLPEAAAAASHLFLLARIRDGHDPQAVWVQASRSFTVDDSGELTVNLPRLFATPCAGLAEVAVGMRPGSGERVTVTRVSLAPQPVTLVIRPVAMAGDFARPQDVTLFISATNNLRQSVAPMAYMKVLDGPDHVAAYEARRVKIGYQSAAYFPFKPKLAQAGSYHLLVRLIENGQDLGSATFDFRVLGG